MKKTGIFVVILLFPILIYSQTKDRFPGDIPLINGPIPAAQEKFTFAILGDKTGVNGDTWHIFDRAVDEINLLRPDFVLCTGDLIQGKVKDPERLSEMWAEFFRHLNRLDVPFYMMAGNHDITNEFMYDYWKERFGKTYYHFVYKNSLYIILNSEEHQKTKQGQLGEEQLEFIKSQLMKNSDVNHVFLLMHKPLWEMDGAAGEEWQQISGWLKDRNCTILAGHRHHLLYSKINGQRHIVLSSTGGSLVPRAIEEMGKFYHYTMVTVEPDTAVIAVIKPGHILPQDTAVPSFVNKIEKVLQLNTRLEMDVNSPLTIASASLRIENPFEVPLYVEMEIVDAAENSWRFDRTKLSDNIGPGAVFEYPFKGVASINMLSSIPKIRCTIRYDGEIMIAEETSFLPERKDGRRFPADVQVSGPFDLDLKRRPASENDLAENFPVIKAVEDEKESASAKNLWKNISVKNGRISLS
ncbi:MAG: hypothetical protein E4H13_05320, partial [Calditrichales bacterium]